jgi:hypothetical protein
MFTAEFANAEMVCIPENLFEDGNGPFWNGATRKACAAAASFTWSTGGLRSSVAIGTSSRS